MTATHRTLVLAAAPRYAEVAARWVRGDAWVVIGPPSRDGGAAGTEPFDRVAISGDLADASWISACFAIAHDALGTGCSATLILVDGEPEVGGASLRTHDLPDDVASRWRMTSMVVEHPWTAIEFARAAEQDDTPHASRSFHHAQAVSFLYRHPELAPRLGNDVVAASVPATSGERRSSPRSRRLLDAVIRRTARPVLRFVGRGTDSRGRRLAVRLDRRAPTFARRVRRLADRIFTTLEPAAQQQVRDVESRLLKMRLPIGSASMPPNLSVGIIVAEADTVRLEGWLRSLRRQRHQYWTCVVVDDASHEDIAAAVEPLRVADSRIRLARHGARRGRSASRNTGLRLLDTDLVLMVGTDRPSPPDALGDAVAGFAPWFRDPGVAGVHGGRGVVDQSGYAGEPNSLSPDSVLVRRSVLDAVGWFDEGIDDRDGWDDLIRRILALGLRFEPYRGGEPPAAPAAPAVRTGAEGTAGSGIDAAAALAADIGFEVGRTGSLDPVDRITGEDQVTPSAPGERDRHDVADSAREGVRRGLADAGATGTRSLLVEDRIWRLGEVIADGLVDRGEPAFDVGTAALTSSRPVIDVMLVAESVADVGPLATVVAEADGSVSIRALDLELVDGTAGATEAWRRAGFAVVPYHDVVTSRALPRVVIGCAPIGPAVRDLLSAARLAGSSCQLIQVPGRPRTMPCSAGMQLDDLLVHVNDAARLVSSLRPDRGEPARRPARRWRGTDFSAVMHAEDGPLDEASIERIVAMRDRHRGETAVIIGNGPSLNETDLGLLTDVPTFGVNAIFLAADRFPEPITYYVVEDTSVFNENVDAIKAFTTDWKLFPAMYRPAFADDEVDETTVFFRMNAGFYDRKTGTFCHPRFSLDATQRLFCGQSVTTINLQLAHWMGFQRVVLIGMDFSYTIPEDVDRRGALIISRSDDPNHFHPDYFGAGKSWKDPLLDRVLVNYHLADEVYRATGREIINATVGGRLDVFPRLSLRDALDGAPGGGSGGDR